MKMWLSGVTGAADACEHLASPYALACFDPQTPRLKMHIVSKLVVAQIDDNRVSCDCFKRNWYSGMKRLIMPGDVVGKTVSCGDDTAVRDGEHVLSIRVIRLLIPRVSRERDAIFDLLPVDGVPPRD